MQKSIEFEEKEALSRPNNVDSQIYFNTCKEIRQLFSEISDLKLKNNPEVMLKNECFIYTSSSYFS